MPWIQFFSESDDKFAGELLQQLQALDPAATEHVDELELTNNIIIQGRFKGQTVSDAISVGLLESRQIIEPWPFVKLNVAEMYNLAAYIEITLEGLRSRARGGLWGLRWQVFLMNGRPEPIGPFASHEHSCSYSDRDEPFIETLYDYLCVLRGTRWFSRPEIPRPAQDIAVLPYLILVGILETARRTFGDVVEQGETFLQLTATTHHTSVVADGLRAATALQGMIACPPVSMAPHQHARLLERYNLASLQRIADELRARL
jgi:hypothetical protein